MMNFREHAHIDTDDLWYDLIDNYNITKSKIDLSKVLEEPSLSRVIDAIKTLKEFAMEGELNDVINYY